MQQTVSLMELSKNNYQSTPVKCRQILAYPQAQPRSAAALQSISIELRELFEHILLVFYRYAFHINMQYT